jgi:hypothetical protein
VLDDRVAEDDVERPGAVPAQVAGIAGDDAVPGVEPVGRAEVARMGLVGVEQRDFEPVLHEFPDADAAADIQHRRAGPGRKTRHERLHAPGAPASAPLPLGRVDRSRNVHG